MRQRMSRSHKSRRGFKVDTILDKLIAKKKQEQNLGIRGYMTLTFLGFYDKRGTVARTQRLIALIRTKKFLRPFALARHLTINDGVL